MAAPDRAGAEAVAPTMADQKPPNLLFITADQLRHDCLGCAGHELVRSAAIDSLAARGVRFGASRPRCQFSLGAPPSVPPQLAA